MKFILRHKRFVFLLLCGRYLEIRARHAVARSLDYLSRAIPEVALRLDSAQDTEQVPVSALRPGDRLPSVRQASASRHISASTVFEAYYLLEARGLVQARPQGLQRLGPLRMP